MNNLEISTNILKVERIYRTQAGVGNASSTKTGAMLINLDKISTIRARNTLGKAAGHRSTIIMADGSYVNTTHKFSELQHVLTGSAQVSPRSSSPAPAPRATRGSRRTW